MIGAGGGAGRGGCALLVDWTGGAAATGAETGALAGEGLATTGDGEGCSGLGEGDGKLIRRATTWALAGLWLLASKAATDAIAAMKAPTKAAMARAFLRLSLPSLVLAFPPVRAAA